MVTLSPRRLAEQPLRTGDAGVPAAGAAAARARAAGSGRHRGGLRVRPGRPWPRLMLAREAWARSRSRWGRTGLAYGI
jgi:hypothetical protein